MSDACTVTIEVICGSQLVAMDATGTSDPYVEVHIAGKAVRKTSVQSSTLNPVWNTKFSYSFTRGSLPEEFTFMIKDKDLLTRDDRMGMVRVALEDVLSKPKSIYDAWDVVQRVKPSDKVSGRLHIRIKISNTADKERSRTSFDVVATRSRARSKSSKRTEFIEMALSKMHDYASEGRLSDISDFMFGQDCETRASLIHHRDSEKITPLHKAAENGHCELVEWLVDRGADVNCVDGYGMTPLHAAATRSQFDCIFALVSHGADVSLSTNNDQLALHYFLKNCRDAPLPMLCCIVTLLAPSLPHLHTTNESGSFLHHTCCNRKSTQVEFLVLLLMENGVNDTAVDHKGQLCWYNLDYRVASRLSKTLDRPDIMNSVARRESSADDLLDGLMIPGRPAPPPPTQGRVDAWGLQVPSNNEEDDAVMRMLATQLADISESLGKIGDVTSDAAKHLEAAREKLKNALTALAPRDTDDIRSGMVMDKFGDEFTRSLIERTLGKPLSDATRRSLVGKGRALVLTRHNQRIRTYYTLYTDCFVLTHAEYVHKQVQELEEHPTEEDSTISFEGESGQPPPQKLKMEDMQLKMVYLMPLKRVVLYRLPSGFPGLEHAFQIVHTQARTAPKSFTVKLDNKKECDWLAQQIDSASQNIRQFIDPAPPVGLFINPSEMLVQGYLAKKGQVLYVWRRYYVRATRSHIFYYNSQDDLTPRGIISIHDVPLTFDEPTLQLEWSDNPNNRRFIFSALSKGDFHHWKRAFFG